jgi:hypothetical protein
VEGVTQSEVTETPATKLPKGKRSTDLNFFPVILVNERDVLSTIAAFKQPSKEIKKRCQLKPSEERKAHSHGGKTCPGECTIVHFDISVVKMRKRLENDEKTLLDAWGLVCDVCKENKIDVDTWGGGGVACRQRNRLLTHQASYKHAQAVELDQQRLLKKDSESAAKKAYTEVIKPRRATLAKCVRILKSLLKAARPIHDYVRDRKIAAKCGAKDLCIETGTLCDPKANYTSASAVAELLAAAAAVCRRKIDAEVREVTAVGLSNDETTGADKNAHSQTWIKLAGGKEIFAGVARLAYNKMIVKCWLLDAI